MLVQDLLRSRRIELDLTMKQIADYVGVTEATVSRWESGEIANMRRDKIYSLAKILQISPLDIFEWEEELPTVTDGQSEKDQRLVKWFRSLPLEKQQAILTLQGGPEDVL